MATYSPFSSNISISVAGANGKVVTAVPVKVNGETMLQCTGDNLPPKNHIGRLDWDDVRGYLKAEIENKEAPTRTLASWHRMAVDDIAFFLPTAASHLGKVWLKIYVPYRGCEEELTAAYVKLWEQHKPGTTPMTCLLKFSYSRLCEPEAEHVLPMGSVVSVPDFTYTM